MNIKLKALLIAFAIIGGLITFAYTLIFYPGAILIGVVAVLVYAIYRLVLSDLEKQQKRKN